MPIPRPSIGARAVSNRPHPNVASDPDVFPASSPPTTAPPSPAAIPTMPIAAAVYVSVNTVKTHCNAIFRKLGVSERKSAVQAARDRDLL